VILLLVALHLFALHEVGSNNPEGIDIKKGPKGNRWSEKAPADGVPFHPYYTVKDTFFVGFFLIICAFVLFFEPTLGGLFLEHDNFVEANPMVTPEHIKPVWYFTPFYAMLRAIPDKLLGVATMGGAVIILIFLPWLDRSPVRSIRYRGWLTKLLIAIFVVAFVSLGWLGLQSGSTAQTWAARIFTFYYFAFFITMPIWTRIDATKPVPQRVPEHD
jgi:ubiquinol-cytochrome c reductase cytochrome b subunit